MKKSALRSSAPFSFRAIYLAVAAAYSLPLSLALIGQTAHAQNANTDIQRAEVQANRPSSLPTKIPTTIEGISAKQIERDINATDAEDALKYLPSLLVRKRYIGDYNHAVLATRASGTGNSARSLVYADGILLSNLLGNGAGFTPRWGNVTPEEIERVDVLYGPFSAAYSGNSVGAVVDYITRMPSKFEAHLKLTGYSQDFKLLGIDKTYSGAQGSATIGDRVDSFSWWINVNHAKSHGQPLVFANKLVSGAPDAGGVQVTGAILDKNPKGQDWWLIGTTTQYDTTQDHAKIKLAYELTPTIKAAYSLGYWSNSTDGNVQSFLKDSAGNPVYSGNVNLGGRKYAITAADFAPNKNALDHVSQGVDFKSNTKGIFDWEFAASEYDYSKDILRASTSAVLPTALSSGAGRITDQKGTGWNTFALKGIYRPNPVSKEHTIEFGYQREAYKLRTLVSNASNWISSDAGTRISAFSGDTRVQSLYVQDAWRMNPQWKTIVGARAEQWSAQDGAVSNATTTLPFFERKENFISPKAAVAFKANEDWTYKASIGRAVRVPTVSELYQGSVITDPTDASKFIINTPTPDLKPEKSWTTEWSAERELAGGQLRNTFFYENTKDALYSQVLPNVTPTVNTVQNVDEIRTFGLEISYAQNDIWLRGLNLSSSLTFADSRIVKNANFIASEGKYQPRIPKWRANLVTSYAQSEKLNYTLGVRYSGTQFGTLDNADPNGFSYQGISKFIVADVRVRYRFDRQFSGSIGIDNLNNQKYWAFHPYTQRTVLAELKWDL